MYDSDQLEFCSLELKDKAQLDAGSVGLPVVERSLPKWVWLYSNLSIDAGLMDEFLDLNGQIVDQDFLGTRDRLMMWGFGQVPQFCMKEITRQPNGDQAAPASDCDNNPL